MVESTSMVLHGYFHGAPQGVNILFRIFKILEAHLGPLRGRGAYKKIYRVFTFFHRAPLSHSVLGHNTVTAS